MRRLFALTLSLSSLATIAGFTFVPSQVAALDYLVGERVTIEETSSDDVYLLGSEARVAAPVRGDVMALAERIVVLSRIEDDLMALGDTIEIESQIESDLILAGGSIVFDADAAVSGDTFIAADHVRLDGSFDGDVRLLARSVTLLPSATIAGSLHLNKSALAGADIENTVAAEGVHFYGDDVGDAIMWPNFLSVLSLAVMNLLVIGFAGQLLTDIRTRVQNHTGRSYLVGALILLLGWTPALLFLFLYPPIALGLFIFWIIATFFLARLFVASLATAYLREKHRLERWWQVALLSVAVSFVVSLLFVLPFSGWLLFVAGFVPILGALGFIARRICIHYLSGGIKIK